jgi:hypothetical protein
MHASERATLFIERDVALHESRVDAMCLEFTMRPSAREKSAFVLKPFRLDDKCALQFCFGEDHDPSKH